MRFMSKNIRIIRALSFMSLIFVLCPACGGGGSGGNNNSSSDTGSLNVTISGLADNVDADVAVTGLGSFNQQLAKSRNLTGLAAGTYTITATRVSTGVNNGITYGHDYDPRPAGQTVSIAAGGTADASVTYSIATEITGPLLINPGLSGIKSYIIYSLPGSTFKWTLSAGTPETSLTGSYGLQWTAPAQIPASGYLTIACLVTEPDASQKTYSQDVWVVPPLGTPPNAIYGTGVSGDSLANLVIGGQYKCKASFRFRAQYSGNLVSFRKKLVWNSSTRSGYSSGTGGILKYEIYPDDGTSEHLPDLKVSPLASLTYANPMTKNDPLLTFSSGTTSTVPPALVAGTLYHLVVSNVDSDPVNNYISTDEIYTFAKLSPMQPTLNDTDFAALDSYVSSGKDVWTTLRGYLPILELDYADGSVQGKGYVDVWGRDPMSISGQASVREIFTVSGVSRVVNAVFVRLRRVSESSPVSLRLEQDDGTPDGTLIEAVDIPAASVLPVHQWVGGAFTSSHILEKGKTYHLRLQTNADSVYEAFPLQDGGNAYYCYSPLTSFGDGYAQFNSGSGWVGWTQWDVPKRKDGDLQFYFVVAP